MSLVVKNLPADPEDDAGWIPGSERSPGGGKWQPTPVFLPGESQGQRSRVGYSPWGCKELDITERLALLHYANTVDTQQNEKRNLTPR